MADIIFPFQMLANLSREQVSALYHRPLLDLLFEAQKVHREFHPPNQVQMCRLLSIKTGGCPEDCAYCPQSALCYWRRKALADEYRGNS